MTAQSNQGVAEARNAGLRLSRAPLVAPLDSDDLWHPTYIEKLRRALATGGPDVVFAFASFRNIDLDGEVLSSAPQYDVEGRAFNRLLIHNFVGNGSGMMFRRDAALAVGGYEPRLQHEFGAQGCEDLLLQLHLAARGSVVAVKEYLVGYRSVPGAMSSDQLRMRRSLVHALEMLFQDIDVGSERSARWALGRARAQCMVHELMFGDVDAALGSLRAALVNDPVGTVEMIVAGTDRAARRVVRRLLRRVRPVSTRGPFHEFHPLKDSRQIRSRLTRWRFKRLGEVDRDVSMLPVGSRDRSPV